MRVVSYSASSFRCCWTELCRRDGGCCCTLPGAPIGRPKEARDLPGIIRCGLYKNPSTKTISVRCCMRRLRFLRALTSWKMSVRKRLANSSETDDGAERPPQGDAGLKENAAFRCVSLQHRDVYPTSSGCLRIQPG